MARWHWPSQWHTPLTWTIRNGVIGIEWSAVRLRDRRCAYGRSGGLRVGSESSLTSPRRLRERVAATLKEADRTISYVLCGCAAGAFCGFAAEQFARRQRRIEAVLVLVYAVVIWLIVAVALCSFWVVGGIGAGVLAYFSTPEFVIGDSFGWVYWLRWGAKIVGRFSGDLLCGVLLGRGLRRISPWTVFVLILLMLSVFVLLVYKEIDQVWLAAVGPMGAVAQLVVQVLAILAAIAFGIAFGQRWRRSSVGRHGAALR